MNRLPGASRTAVGARSALVAPDGHFRVPRAGTDGVAETGLLGPGLGAGFEWTLIDLEPGARLAALDAAPATWFVLEGVARLLAGAAAPAADRDDEDGGGEVAAGGAVALPAAHMAAWHALTPTRLLRSRSLAVVVAGGRPTAADAPPAAAVALARALRIDAPPAGGFRGAEGVTVRALPIARATDLWFVLELQPGADLPFVETHPEPHGVWLLAGRGLARLGSDWFPVAAGDALWIDAFCPHWFCALGPTPMRYLLLKQPAAGG